MPVRTLFDYLADGLSLDYFLETKGQGPARYELRLKKAVLTREGLIQACGELDDAAERLAAVW